MQETVDPRDVEVGDRLRFDGKATSWLVRAQSENGRYLLATSSMFGTVYYSVLDLDQGIRGSMNAIGHDMGINTTSGPDPAIDETMGLLDGGRRVALWNRVRLAITTRTPKSVSRKD